MASSLRRTGFRPDCRSRGTPTNEAAYPVLEAAKVPLVGPSTGAMSMYDPPRRYLFPVRPSYHSETAKIVAQLVSTGINRIAVFHTDDSFGKDGLTGTLNAMKAQGLNPIVVASHARGTVQVEQAVAAIAKSEAQAVIMVTVLDAGVAFIKQMRKTGASQGRRLSFATTPPSPGKEGCTTWTATPSARRRSTASATKRPEGS